MHTQVLIADDHPLFRAAMKQALSTVVQGELHEAASLNEACSVLKQHEAIELVFLDLNMPGNDGLSGLAQLLAQGDQLLVVVVSAEEDPCLIKRVMEMGASGYIPKSPSLDNITGAVKQIMEGEVWVPSGLLSLAELSQEESHFAKSLSLLTPHQFRVLKMLADGLLNKQIAYELDISESTVKQHVSAVLRKLKVVNRTQAGVLFNQLISARPGDRSAAS